MSDVKLTFEGMRYLKRSEESVLDALTRGGANVAFSCRKGSCHVCLLQAVSGQPSPQAQDGLARELKQAGLFKPCAETQNAPLSMRRPDLACFVSSAVVHDKRLLAPDVVGLWLEPPLDVRWRAGQFVSLRGPGNEWRSYSISSVRDEAYFMELHIRRWPGGKVSSWVADDLAVGDEVEFRGPSGTCFYDPAHSGRPLWLIATGTGISPLIGVAREALLASHQGEIRLFHGCHRQSDLYLLGELEQLSQQYPNFGYCASVSGDERDGSVRAGRALTVAFEHSPDLTEHVVFVCGNPDAVQATRARAIAAGARRQRIYADPFEAHGQPAPTDKRVLTLLEPDPELWQALEGGPGLTRILEDFYERVYNDARLAPFFHRVTKERAIQKQYEFLRDVFTGRRDFFGARPFNAHHWMVISDELFDYREELFLECLQRYGLSQELTARFSALHEWFRRDIVKAAPRGLVVNGVEEVLEGYSLETLSFGTVCDGCEAPMEAGSSGRMHRRTGELFCATCAAREVGASQPPHSCSLRPSQPAC